MRADTDMTPRVCKACGTTFHRKTRLDDRGRTRPAEGAHFWKRKLHCSMECQMVSQRAFQREATLARFAELPRRYCPGCRKLLRPHMRASGRVEAVTAFQRRQHCGPVCAGLTKPGQTLPRLTFSERARRIKAADKCGRCGRTAPETKLEIHHVDGDWTNNASANLEAICRSCHMKEHWAEWRSSPKRQVAGCEAEGCTRKAASRFTLYCPMHNKRFMTWGHPLVRFNKVGKQLEGPPTAYSAFKSIGVRGSTPKNGRRGTAKDFRFERGVVRNNDGLV